jgi:hypothetical protein
MELPYLMSGSPVANSKSGLNYLVFITILFSILHNPQDVSSAPWDGHAYPRLKTAVT